MFSTRINRAAMGIMLAFTFSSAVHAQQEAYLTAEKSGDGALNPSEFKTFIDLMAQSGKPVAAKLKASGRYSLAFGRIDKNRDGLISPEELTALR